MILFGLLLLATDLWGNDIPKISTLLPEKSYREILENRDTFVSAKLEDIDHPPAKKYSCTSAMLVHAGFKTTRSIFTDYQAYAKIIPYIDLAEYSPITHILKLQGGIWRWKMRSALLFEEKSDQWIHYCIIQGHFQGLCGDFFFEAMGERGTLVYMRGQTTGTAWPPRIVLERGAEIVFGYTAKKMRSYVELQSSHAAENENGRNDPEAPKPRGRL